MALLIKIVYLFGSAFIGIYAYFWSGIFKMLGAASTEEINEDETAIEEIVSENQTAFVNYYGTIIFLILGTLIWVFQSVTIGKVAQELSDNSIIRWVGYVLFYFLFLRIPFGISHKMIIKSYDLNIFLEKIIFSFVMIVTYIFTIWNYEALPSFLKWHLSALS